MQKYSEFINFPIYLWTSKEVDVEVEADAEETSEDEEEKTGFCCALVLNVCKTLIDHFLAVSLCFSATEDEETEEDTQTSEFSFVYLINETIQINIELI